MVVAAVGTAEGSKSVVVAAASSTVVVVVVDIGGFE